MTMAAAMEALSDSARPPLCTPAGMDIRRVTRAETSGVIPLPSLPMTSTSPALKGTSFNGTPSMKAPYTAPLTFRAVATVPVQYVLD